MKTPVYSGIIMNYTCTASCRHCMFASAPDVPKEYITEDTANRLAELLSEAGTTSVHIGGGEPFMNFGALCGLISALHRHGVDVDYIETNAFWCADETVIDKRLATLKSLGVTTIMVSVDPFHIEYVPLERPLRLCQRMNEAGFDYFLWQERYLRKLHRLDRTRVHTKEELQKALGKHYVTDTAAEYGLGMNGRALKIAGEMYASRPAEELAVTSPCASLLGVGHCHLDLYGNFVPSGCPGLAAAARDALEENIPAETYPVMARLLRGGTAALYEYAVGQGFVPAAEGYPTKCAFCYAMREFLWKNAPSADLAPGCFYRSMEKTMTAED